MIQKRELKSKEGDIAEGAPSPAPAADDGPAAQPDVMARAVAPAAPPSPPAPEEREKERALATGMRFERLIADISAQFIDLSPDALEGKIHAGLQAIGLLLAADICFFNRFAGEIPEAHHTWSADPFREPSSPSGGEDKPWHARIRPAGGMIAIDRAAERPPGLSEGAWQDLRAAGVSSAVIIPLSLGGTPVGNIGLASAAPGVRWPGEQLSRLRLVGGIFASALERIHAIKRLRESEEKHALIFNNSHSAMLLIAPVTGEIVDANTAACEFYGYSLAELSKMTIYDINDLPEHRIRLIMAKAFGGEKAVLLFRHRLASGALRHVEVHSGPVRIHGRDLLFSVVHDVTDRVRAQRELAENRKKFQDLFHSLDDFILVISPELTLLHANPAVAERFGYALQELSGMPLSALYPEEAFSRVETRLSALSAKGPGHCYVPLMARDGQRVPVETKFLKGRWDGRPVIIAISRDLTERTESEENRKNLEEQVRRAQKMEAIGALAGGIAHDFNNILSSIIGYTEIALHDELPRDTPARFSLEQVLKAGRRARNLVKQILAFSRQDTTEKQFLRLSPLVKEVLKLLRATLPAGIEIRSEIPPLDDTIRANPTQMHQILMNLGANAAYAMRREGGVLDVRIAEREVGSGEAPLPGEMPPGRYLALSIGDTGPGIDPSILTRIFDPFFTTKPKEEGTGLGLPMVHGIVKAHGGHISVASRPGEGTRFTILLPLCQGPEEREAVEPVTAHGGGHHILVVDDEKSIVVYVEKTLKRFGYRVTAVEDSEKALEIFENMPDNFDLLITDQTMPKMTGDLLATRLREIRPELPVILFSGFSDKLTELKAREVGISAFLMKPIVRAELAEAVRNALEPAGKP